MAYADQSANAVPSAPSLISDSGHMTERLAEIHSRLIKVGNMLHGSEPHDVGGQPAQIEPEPTVRRNIDRAHNLLCSIEGELSRVESRL
jgi:hypothetical protein